MLVRALEVIGAFVLHRFEEFGTIVLLYRETMRELGRRPRPKHILAQMSHLGVDSLLIVSLTLMFTGVVFTLQTADILIRFGAQGTIGGIISIAIGRELGPDGLILVNLSGRGDKDMHTAANFFGLV